MHEILYEHAKSLGVEIHLGANVTEYWEDASAGKAGVLVNGRKLEGDLVVGADGTKSKARNIILVRWNLGDLEPEFTLYLKVTKINLNPRDMLYTGRGSMHWKPESNGIL